MKMNTFLARHFWSHNMDPVTEIIFFIYEIYDVLEYHKQGENFVFAPLQL